MTRYCVSCRRKTPMKVMSVKRNKSNGANMARGKCTVCGKGMCSMLPRRGNGILGTLKGLVGSVI